LGNADDFEVSIFLTELSSRHALLTKQKTFRDKPRLQSNSARLTGWLNNSASAEHPMTGRDQDEGPILNEEDDAGVHLTDIPDVREGEHPDEDIDEISEQAFETSQPRSARQATRRRATQSVPRGANDADEEEDQDTKKMALETSYDGFSIYGRILCLVVKKRASINPSSSNTGAHSHSSGPQMLEDWVSTQAAQDNPADDDQEDDG
jgi:hypothetical protein